MAQVSRRKLKKEVEQKIQTLLTHSLSFCTNQKAVSDFIDDLLTPTEQIVLSKRLAIAYLLEKGYSYAVIKDLVKVTNSTIGAVSLMLKKQGNGLRSIFDKVKKDKDITKVFEELGDFAIELIGMGKGADWKNTKSILARRKQSRQTPF
jgi:uncharacterized protein YerC